MFHIRNTLRAAPRFLAIFLIGNIVAREAVSDPPPRQYSKQESLPTDLATGLASRRPSAGVPATASRTLSYRSRQAGVAGAVASHRFPNKTRHSADKMTWLVGTLALPMDAAAASTDTCVPYGNAASPGG